MAFSLHNSGQRIGRSARTSLLLLPLVFTSLSGCSALQATANQEDDSAPSVATQAGTERHDSSTDKQPVYRRIPANTLYSLLVAEMAGQRQRFDISLYNYMDQARTTRDPDIAERASRIARYVGSNPHALEATQIWLDESPLDPAAHQAAAQIYMEQGQFREALKHFEVLQELAGVSQYDYLAANASHLPRPQQEELANLLAEITDTQPDSFSAWYARGIMAQHLGYYEQALGHVNHSLKLNNSYLSASLQKARLLAILKRYDDAIDWLDDLINDHPDHKGSLVLRARILLDKRDMDGALTAFRDLHKTFSDDGAILLSLALLEEETGYREEAREHFYQLLATESNVSEAHYYLARLNEDDGDIDGAIQHYSLVDSGRELLPAQLKAASLINSHRGLDAARDYLAQAKEQYPQYNNTLTRIEVDMLTRADLNDEALWLINQALHTTPDDIDLLYTRAMLAQRMDNIALLETDLREIIRLRPNHAEALNALGYTLADRTDRWSEALPLIERALELTPDNPAVIDSLGWIYFRMGDVKRARPLLEKAFAMMKDHEIAAHLGELLWITGEKEQALSVWSEGLSDQPDSQIIDETLQRLNIDPADLNTEASL